MINIEKGREAHSYKINIFGIRIKFRNIFEIKNNKVVVVKKDGTEVRKIPKGLKVIFRGANSTIKIYEPCPKFKNSQIMCFDNANVEIDSSNTTISNLSAHIISKNGKLKIGKNVKFRGTGIFIGDHDNLSVTIGDNSLFATRVAIRTGDYHVVYNALTKEPLNKPADVNIGKHCWLCEDVIIAKGVSLADDTIVSAKSYVTKSFAKPNTIIGGIPAKVIKDENTTWSEMSYEQYVESMS